MKKIRMKSAISLALVLTMLLLVFTACGNSTTPPAEPKPSADTPAASDTPDSPDDSSAGGEYDWGDETYSLIFANADTSTSGPSQGTDEAIKYITEKSGGHVKIDAYYNTLVESGDLLDSVCEGVCDIAYLTTTLYPGTMQALDILSQKFTGEMPGIAGINEICRTCIDTIPVFQKEAEAMGIHLIDCTVTPSIIFGCHNDDANKISTPDDLKGKVVGATGNFALSLETYGASTIALPPSDWYTSFERGLLDVHSISWAICNDFGLSDVVDSYITFGNNGGLGVTPQAVMVNLDTWESLPEHVQNLIVEGFRYGYDWTEKRNEDTEARVHDEEVAAGKVIHHIDEADMGPWYELAEVGMNLWAKSAEEAGYDAEQIRADYDAVVADYLATH